MPKVWNKRDKNCPKNAVYIGRPSKWGNPFKIGDDYNGVPIDREHAISQYKDWLLYSDQGYKLFQDLYELKGKDLCCWCKPAMCHGDVLLELANKENK